MGGSTEKTTAYKSKVGVPVYSGKDAEQRLVKTGVIRQLYNARSENVGTYSPKEIPELETASELKEWLQNTEILIDLENRTDPLFDQAIHAIQSLYQSRLYESEDGQEAFQALLELTQIMLLDPSRQRLKEAFSSLGANLEPLVMVASMSESAFRILGLAEALRQRQGRNLLSTKYLLWGIYQGVSHEIRELLISQTDGKRQVNVILNEWLGIREEEANNLLPASGAAFLKAPKTKNCLLAIGATVHMAAGEKPIDEQSVFAGLLSVPKASAVKWMAKMLGISTGDLLENFTKPSSKDTTQSSAWQMRLYKSLGEVFWKLDRYQEALTAYAQAIHLSPSDGNLYKSLGEVFWKLDRYQEALTAYAQAIHLSPSDASAYFRQGNLLFTLKRYEDALAAYEQTIFLDPSHYPRAYYNKGIILENLNKLEEALLAYEQAIRLDPKIEELSTNTAQSTGSLRARVKLVQQFLINAGFDLHSTTNPLGFFAVALEAVWRHHFPGRVYIRILFGVPLDHNTVRSIYHDAQKYSDRIFVIVDQQPTISGWMTIGALRAEEKDGCVFLPIAETLLKEGTEASSQTLILRAYVDERLGKDFDPYDVRDAVSDAVSFFGREGVTDELSKLLRRGQRVGLFGLQKIGKSSVLKRLQKRLDLPTAYVYLIKGDNLVSIYERILEEWAIDIRVKYPGLQWSAPVFTTDSDPRRIFDVSAKDLLLVLRGMTKIPLLAIFFDEIENIIPYDEGNQASLDLYMTLMDSLRGIQQETGGLSLLIAGLYPDLARWNYFWGKQKNPMFQVIAERFLPPLEKEDCVFMIRSLGQQINLKYDEAAIEYILSMSGAHPFLARQLCSFAYKRHSNMHTVSLQDVQKAAQDFVHYEVAASYFNNNGLWGELSKVHIWGEDTGMIHHKILMALAASSGGLTLSELCFDANKITIEQSITALKERGIIATIDGSQHYQIIFGLFRSWIRRYLLGMEE